MTAAFWAISAGVAFATAYLLSAPLRQKANKHFAFWVLAIVPLFSLAIYLYLGNPQTADQPLMPRLAAPLSELPPGAVLARLENELRRHPDDPRGWRLLARLHTTIGNPTKAADAWQRLLQLANADVEAQVGLAQALIEQEGGVVNPTAMALLEAALAVEPDNLSARFWRAEAWSQQGEMQRAKQLWRDLRRALPDKAPLAKMLDQKLAN